MIEAAKREAAFRESHPDREEHFLEPCLSWCEAWTKTIEGFLAPEQSNIGQLVVSMQEVPHAFCKIQIDQMASTGNSNGELETINKEGEVAGVSKLKFKRCRGVCEHVEQ